MIEFKENFEQFNIQKKFKLGKTTNINNNSSIIAKKQKNELLNKLNNQEKNQNKIFEQEKLNYCKNPLEYLDYLAKKYFKENFNALEGLEIKKDLLEIFYKTCNQIEEHIHDYAENREKKIKELENKLYKKTNGEFIPLIENDIPTSSNKNKITIQNNEFKSKPMNIDDKEFLKRLIGNQDLNGITINMDPSNYIRKNKNSKLNENNLFKNALSCLKGDKLVTPKSNFLIVKELGLNDIDHKKIVDTKNLQDLKNKIKIEQYNKEIMGKNKKSIKDRNKKEKKLEELISYSNNAIKKMEQYQKEKRDLIKALQKELNHNYEKNAIQLATEKLAICEKNLDQFENKDFNNNFNNNYIPENSLIDWKERKEMLDKQYNDTQTMVNNFMKGRGASLSKPLKIGGNTTTKSKNKKNKRNKSAYSYYKNF